MKIEKGLITVREFLKIVNSNVTDVPYCDISISLLCYNNSCGCGCGVGGPHADLVVERATKTGKGKTDLDTNEFIERIKYKYHKLSLDDVFIKVQAFDKEDFQAFAQDLRPDFNGHNNGVFWQIHIKSREEVEKKEREDREYLHSQRKHDLEFYRRNSPDSPAMKCCI